ncbi:DUF1295-domain-containing protein [Lindgomyces ingoldianus]|uniref:DUF1295-domain-containing protein n=1 Tax=Lindgomyces ingoldianus TaxID=673940 RepID=A0ACB6RCR8_9PLEO|nr:DUF1295-domain-containing protein [Lindgomyces ingoldianus]KAF2476936.1 DUF1295-domain-containing protein [Lindgomyces ingoldianus]
MHVPDLELAVPVLKTLPECADFTKTVSPFLPQLYALPQQIFDRINDLGALRELYTSTNPLITALAFSLFLAGVVLIVSEANRNYSQVDRLWSIIPVVYNCHYALWAHLVGLRSQRLDHVMAVSILWGARLTFNYWRKGGYSVGSEDYRWEYVKNYAGPTWMFIFNIGFISLGQCLLLFAITSPTYILLLTSRLTPDTMSTYDNLFSRLMFFLVLVEFFADQQQWTFYLARTKYRATAKLPKDQKFTREQLDRGFNTTGLFAWSRHPNFAAEQAVWVCLYQWCCCETFTYMNWTFAGAMGYLLLFQASTWFTEWISTRKYPEYKVYQQRVGKFLPRLITRGMDEVKKPEENAKEGKEAKSLKDIRVGGKTKKR